jgi:predicted dehydrogenase
MIRIGVIGYGYWGPNLVRNFSELGGCRVGMVSDLQEDRLARVQARYPGVAVTRDSAELIDSPEIDAVAISTPVSTHYDLALRALRAGKHVLVEKPLTVSSEQAARLIDEAEGRKLVLMVDHTFVYTGAVRKILELTQSAGLGDIYYYDSVRINLGLFQEDVDVIYDLAVHDFAIMDYVLPFKPVAISATGISHVPGSNENIAYITAFFEQPLIAHVHVNWLSPVKVRQTLIGGSHRMILYDDVQPSEKIKIYDKGIDLSSSAESAYHMLVSYRSGDMWAPKLDMTEALRVELGHFLDCIGKNLTPLTDGHAGYRVVKILEAATESVRGRGRLIELAGTGARA